MDKKDDDEHVLPFEHLDKGGVLQNVRLFGAPRVRSRDAYLLLTQILYLLTARSEALTRDEATNVFFAVTKLFQSHDASLRRMMYLLLKELSAHADDTIIAFAMLIKDVTSDVPTYQAHAIRVIAGIMDASMLGQMERYLRQAIVSRDAYVAASALVASVRLADKGALDVIRRWVGEVQECLQAGTHMAQYHALGLLHRLKSADRRAIAKLVSTYASSPAQLRSPLAHMLLVRFAADVLAEERERDPALFRFLEAALRHRSELVAFEAARAIAALPGVTESELSSPVAVLQLFLASSKTTLRFAAARVLNSIATTHPAAIGSSCAYEMENLIGDPNRSVATLAITTLLKVETESRVERLMKQITGFIADISDDFKIVVVDAIRTLSVKFPSKHASVMLFLAAMLRDQGGLEYKSAIVQCVLSIIERIPEAKEAGLEHLCEFIEDCEHAQLTKQVLHLLGEEAPKTSSPGRYIRYIYNRVVLEQPSVRSAAVATLAKLALSVPALRPEVLVLLHRCVYDSDDEVRDRATFYEAMLSEVDNDAHALLAEPLDVPLENLEVHLSLNWCRVIAQAALVGFLDADEHNTFFSFDSVPREVRKPRPADAQVDTRARSGQQEGDDEAQSQALVKQMRRLQELFAPLGKLLNTTPPVELTERETAYHVSLVKHVFAEHVVLQYSVSNTLPDQHLRNVSVELSSDDGASVTLFKVAAHVSDGGYTVERVLPCAELAYGATEHVYAVLRRPDGEGVRLVRQSFYNHLRFDVHDVDGEGVSDEQGFPDEYPLDDTAIAPGDFVRPRSISGAFESHWERWADGEAQTRFALAAAQSVKSTLGISTSATLLTSVDGVTQMMRTLHMGAVEHSDEVDESKSRHILLLAGDYVDAGTPALARLRMRYVAGQGLGVELTVRSPDAALANALANVMFAG